MRLAIIGAGAAGLTSAKNAKERGVDCVVYEQWSEIGGVWVYTDYTDLDQYGYPILNPMYKGLVTNLPKEIMAFSDLPYPKQSKSYLGQQEILNYLALYAKHFNLKPLIKLNTIVKLVKPQCNGKWAISIENKINKTESTNIFDAVMICTGNYHTPKMPTIPGMELFKGEQIHSKTYRKPDGYKGKVVLIVGGGTSGIDIVLQISSVAKQVIFNYRTVILNRTYPKNVTTKKCNIEQIDEYSVIFDDGINVKIDCIIYCTGYYHNYPFLHERCGISAGSFVHPLYKHTVNIHHPTMAFIGLPIYISPFITYDLQARFFINHLLGIVKFPPQEDMMKDADFDVKERRSKGMVGSKFHYFHDCQEAFYNDLARLGQTTNVPIVIRDIYKIATDRYFSGIENFKSDRYQILDEEHFIHKTPK